MDILYLEKYGTLASHNTKNKRDTSYPDYWWSGFWVPANNNFIYYMVVKSQITCLGNWDNMTNNFSEESTPSGIVIFRKLYSIDHIYYIENPPSYEDTQNKFI